MYRPHSNDWSPRNHNNNTTSGHTNNSSQSHSQSPIQQAVQVHGQPIHEKQYTLPERYYDKSNRGWCHAAWINMHAIADAFPPNPTEEEKHLIREYLMLQGRFSPCEQCSRHFQEILEKYPVECETGDQLSQWMIRAHNEVNKQSGHVEMDPQEATQLQNWNRAVKWSLVANDLRNGNLLFVPNGMAHNVVQKQQAHNNIHRPAHPINVHVQPQPIHTFVPQAAPRVDHTQPMPNSNNVPSGLPATQHIVYVTPPVHNNTNWFMIGLIVLVLLIALGLAWYSSRNRRYDYDNRSKYVYNARRPAGRRFIQTRQEESYDNDDNDDEFYY